MMTFERAKLVTLLFGVLFLSGCASARVDQPDATKIQRIADTGPVCPAQNGALCEPGSNNVPVRLVTVTGNAGGEYEVGESNWRLAGAALLSGNNEHMIRYPSVVEGHQADQDSIKPIKMLRPYNQVIWKQPLGEKK